MAQVTVELTEEQEEELGGVEDIADSETVVARILEEEGDSKRTENWKKLVRKLSNKRKKKLKKKGEQRPAIEAGKGESSEEAEDDIPDDWRPDFIPKEWEVGEASGQPDVVQTSLGSLQQELTEDPANSPMVRFRSEHR